MTPRITPRHASPMRGSPATQTAGTYFDPGAVPARSKWWPGGEVGHVIAICPQPQPIAQTGVCPVAEPATGGVGARQSR